MADSSPAKRAKRSAAQPVTAVGETNVFDLPGELLHLILGGTTIRIERWTDLSLVCRSWQAQMQSLVPAEVFISDKHHLKDLQNCQQTIGGIVVKESSRVHAPLKAVNLLQYLGSKRCNKVALQSLVVRPRAFFTNWDHARTCLQKLACLRRLELRMEMDEVPQLCQGAPPGLLKLALTLSSRIFSDAAVLQQLTQLTQLQEMSVRVLASQFPTRESVTAHRKALKPIFKAAQILLGNDVECTHSHPTARKAGRTSGRPSKPRTSQTSKPVEKKAVHQGGDCGSRNEGGPSRSARVAGGYDPRIAKIQELMGEVCRRAEIAKTPRTSPAEVDYVNIMLQGLQWQLALAMVLDSDESRRGPPLVEQLQHLWHTADIGTSWLDLRGMRRLVSLVVEGVAAVWVPRTLHHLQVDSQGYVGPLPARLRSYSAKLAASSGLTHWDLRPLGFLPLTTLALTIHSSEIRHTREFCFQVLQGTHSLQLHGQLETLSLKTDRGLHVDAQMCHRLLSFLAQKKRLRQLQVCSGYLRLQSIQGDSHQGRGVAALNLLSDLKDQCGWLVEQPREGKAVPGSEPQVTICRPPAEWPFDLPDEEPDFVSDFE